MRHHAAAAVILGLLGWCSCADSNEDVSGLDAQATDGDLGVGDSGISLACPQVGGRHRITLVDGFDCPNALELPRSSTVSVTQTGCELEFTGPFITGSGGTFDPSFDAWTTSALDVAGRICSTQGNGPRRTCRLDVTDTSPNPGLSLRIDNVQVMCRIDFAPAF